MKYLVIEAKSKADAKIFIGLAKKIGLSTVSINTNKWEEPYLAGLIDKGMKTKSVERQSIMDILNHRK